MSYFTYENKRIFYRITGSGKPLALLHGNTASSKMFEMLLPLYTPRFQVILLDFLGNGQSDRVEKFPKDLWLSQAKQIASLLERLDLGKVNLAGVSGGAWAALNAALLRPDLIGKVVADSFDGRSLAADFSAKLQKERAFAKSDPLARQFYEWQQGEDWETVVDLDTQALVACANSKAPLFCKPLDALKVPVLLMGSLEDEMCRKDLADEYERMKEQIGDCKIHLFKTGGHPAIASNAQCAAAVIADFLT